VKQVTDGPATGCYIPSESSRREAVMANKKTSRKPKDLDPKSRAKKVKGGRTTLGTQVRRVEARTGRAVQRIGRNVERGVLGVGRDIEHAGRGLERALNPPS
jgi:hypothetical protein